MKQQRKEQIIAFFTFVGGLYFFLEFVLPGIVLYFYPEMTLASFFKILLPDALLPPDIDTHPAFQAELLHDAISKGVQVVGVMAIGLGIINILRVHGGAIVRSRAGWHNSLALLIGLFTVFTFEFIDLRNGELRGRQRERIDTLVQFNTVIRDDFRSKLSPTVPRLKALALELTAVRKETTDEHSERTLTPQDATQAETFQSYLQQLEDAERITSELSVLYAKNDRGAPTVAAIEAQTDRLSETLKAMAESVQTLASARYETSNARQINEFIFKAFFTPLGSAMFSLLAFYIATAAYRSFRIRSLEALIMMIPAIIVMLGQIPDGPLYVSEDLPAYRAWLLRTISTPAFRAITFGSLIAALAMSVRMWLSLEKSPLSKDVDSGGGQ